MNIIIFLDRRNKTIIRKLHINEGVRVQTPITLFDLANTIFFLVKLELMDKYHNIL